MNEEEYGKLKYQEIQQKLKSGEIKKWKNKLVTSEEYDRLYSLYARENFSQVDEYIVLNTKIDVLHYHFEKNINSVLEKVNRFGTAYSLSAQSGIERSCIQKMLSGELMPNVINFLKLLKFINSKIEDFNMHYLFSPRARKMQGLERPYLESKIDFEINAEEIKKRFPQRLKDIFDFINKNWTTYWISEQSGVQRNCVRKLVDGELLPSIVNLLRLLIFIKEYIKDFRISDFFSPTMRAFEKEEDLDNAYADFYDYGYRY